ncbi:MAG: hypothetical protein ABIF82_10980 [Planctomycetota bacterium]
MGLGVRLRLRAEFCDSGEGRHWGWESPSNQLRGLRLIPLHEVVDEAYTVYFPIRPRK